MITRTRKTPQPMVKSGNAYSACVNNINTNYGSVSGCLAAMSTGSSSPLRSDLYPPQDETIMGYVSRGKGRRPFLPVSHTKREYRVGELAYVSKTKSDTFCSWYENGVLKRGPQYSVNGTRGVAPPAPSASTLLLPPLPTTSAMSALSYEAWLAMAPQFESGFSASLSLFELKDFKSLMKIGMRGAQGIRRYAKHLVGSSKTKFAAGAFLTNEFAVQPLARDIFVSQRLIESYRRDLARYKAQGQVTNTHHFTKVLPHSSSATVTDAGGGYWDWWTKSVVFNACARLTYRHDPNWEGPGLWDYMGMPVTPATIWNGIPLSFVVDMFLNIGDALEKASFRADATCRVSEYCESYKQTSAMVRGRKNPWTNSTWDYNHILNISNRVADIPNVSRAGYLPISATVQASYTRLVCDPTTSGFVFPEFRVPSGKAAGLLGAMATSMGLLDGVASPIVRVLGGKRTSDLVRKYNL